MTTPVVTQVEDPIGKTLQKLLKPGAKTTEFITMIAVWAGALATLLGAFNTSNPKFNAILKISALVAAAVSQVSYALSRGDTKAALASLTSSLASTGVIAYKSQRASTPAEGQAGYITLGPLGTILLVIGVMLAIVFSGSLLLLISGVVIAVIGFVLILHGLPRGSRRL